MLTNQIILASSYIHSLVLICCNHNYLDKTFKSVSMRPKESKDQIKIGNKVI